MPPRLVLWISPGACSLFPHILLREASATFSVKVVDILSSNGFPAEHRAINPKLRLPILEIHDERDKSASGIDPAPTIITETVAIATAITQLFPAAHLFGPTDLTAVRCYEWFNWLSGTVHERGFGAFFAPQNYADDEAAHDAVRRQARAWIEKCYADIEERLATEKEREGRKGEWAVGDTFTAADVFLYVLYRWGYLKVLNFDMVAKYPRYTALVKEVTARKAVLETVKEEGIPLIEDDRADGLVDD